MNQRNKAWVTPLLVMLLIGLMLGFVIFRIGSLSDRLDQTQSDRDDLHQALQQQEKASQTLAKQVRRLGGTPLVSPPTVEVTAGPSGPVGAAGAIGPVGPAGATGATGAVGRTGPAGSVGPVGPAGATGATGQPGPKGDDGAKGPAGDKGDTGPAGPPGPAGADGKDGKDGAPGPQGPNGPAGSVTPGDYACPSGQYVTGFHVAADGSVSLDCAGVLSPGQQKQAP